MINLLQYYPALGRSSASPFCIKAELLLKMSGVEYQLKNIRDPRQTPKKKLPVLEDDAQVIADSTFIQMHLEKKYQVDFYPGLDSQEIAQAKAIQVMIEEHLYWVMVYSRWIEEDNWQVIKKHLFAHIPMIPALLILPMIRKQVLKKLKGHGMGLHSVDEIYQLGERDLQILSDLLGEKEWLLGSKKTAADLVMYAFLEIINTEELPSPLRDSLRSKENLMRYIESETRFL